MSHALKEENTSQVGPQSPLEEFVARNVANSLGVGTSAVIEATNLFDIGLDSFGFMQLISAIEDEYKVEFTDTELLSPAFKNVKEISLLIHSKLGNA